MRVPLARVSFSILACLAVLVPIAARSDVQSADALFSQAKGAWRSRTEVPFVRFGLRERYTWRNRVHDNWWQASYRDADRALALSRILVPEQEAERLKGTPIAIHLKFHKGNAHADSFDTNPDADAFPILDPLIEPNASFGLLKREPKSALVGSLVAPPSPRPEPSAVATSAPSPSAVPVARETPLREIIRVEASSRDYAIALAGNERLGDVDTYHLTLTPLRDPHLYRLRDLWIDTTSYQTVQLAVQGLFSGKPYDDARWIVSYVKLDGRYYVQQIKTPDSLRFGLDRNVSDLEFDFVQYEFPPAMSPMTFARYL